MSYGDMIPYAFLIFLMIITLVGLYGVPSSFEVDVRYIIGILTTSGILFGFWAILIGRKPGKEEKTKRWQYEHIISKVFFFSFGFLLMSVLMTYLTALNKVSSLFTFLFCICSFYLNAFLVALTLYYYKFTEPLW